VEDNVRNQDKICEACDQFVAWGDWRVATGEAHGFLLREGRCACEAKGFVQTRLVPDADGGSGVAGELPPIPDDGCCTCGALESIYFVGGDRAYFECRAPGCGRKYRFALEEWNGRLNRP